MGFSFAHADSGGLIDSGTITAIHPHPFPEYPTTFENTSLASRDGQAIIQSGNADTRVRRWVWNRVNLSTPGYARLFEKILALQVSLREQTPVSDSPGWIFLKEDITNNFNKLVLSGQTWIEQPDFIRVKVISVTEKLSQRGGNVKYDSVEMAFYIDDENWNRF